MNFENIYFRINIIIKIKEIYEWKINTLVVFNNNGHVDLIKENMSD